MSRSFETISSISVSVPSGAPVTLWGSAGPDADTRQNAELQLSPDRTIVIGRAEGHHVPYLDPTYRATTIVPLTGRSILAGGCSEKDQLVSRAHFMLRGDAGGIMLTNGVPKSGGGIRPPLNGTRLLTPEARRLDDAEDYLIRHGESIVLVLPNETLVQLDAR